MRAEPSPEPRLEHVYVRRSGPGGGGGQPNSPVYAQIAKKRNSNNSSNSSVADRIAQFEYQSKEIVRDSSPSVDQVRMGVRSWNFEAEKFWGCPDILHLSMKYKNVGDHIRI
jgi:hypothetical protein